MSSRIQTILVLALVFVAAACSPTSAPETTTAPTKTSTTIATTTTLAPATTGTTRPPPELVAVSGGLPPGIVAAVVVFYSWLADHRNPAPTIPRGMLRAFRGAEHPVKAKFEAAGVSNDLSSGDSVAVVHVGDDTLFLVKDTGQWRIAAADLSGLHSWFGDEPNLLLVLGSDAREGQNQQTLRADSIHIVGLDTTRPAASIVGFPRDAWVQGPIGGSKFTNVMANRGPEVMVDTMQSLTGLDLDGYLVTGFAGFEGLIGDLGGLVIDLPRSIRSGIDGWQDYPSGLQTLGPTAALRLARIRKTIPGGDFGRSANHGLIMLAALIMIQEMGVDELPELLDILIDNVWTDLSTEQLLRIAASVYALAPEDMVNMVMPGSVGSVGGQSVVFLANRSPDIYADLADGVIDDAP